MLEIPYVSTEVNRIELVVLVFKKQSFIGSLDHCGDKDTLNIQVRQHLFAA